jgi:hypothetical protein
VFLGAAIWGPIGAIIGVPIAAVVASIMETYGRRYELVPYLASQADNGESVTDRTGEGVDQPAEPGPAPEVDPTADPGRPADPDTLEEADPATDAGAVGPRIDPRGPI